MIKRALVTGGTSEVGAAIVKSLSEKYKFVRFTYNSDKKKALELRDQLRGSGVDCEAVQVDLSKRK